MYCWGNNRSDCSCCYTIFLRAVLLRMHLGNLCLCCYRGSGRYNYFNEQKKACNKNNKRYSGNFVANPENPYAVEAKVDAGKETESTLKAYQIPVGEYKVTNKTDAAAEINVYSGIIRETEDGTIVLHDSKKELVSTIKVGAAKYETVKIEKNQFVEAAEGTELFFETK